MVCGWVEALGLVVDLVNPMGPLVTLHKYAAGGVGSRRPTSDVLLCLEAMTAECAKVATPWAGTAPRSTIAWPSGVSAALQVACVPDVRLDVPYIAIPKKKRGERVLGVRGAGVSEGGKAWRKGFAVCD